MGATRGSNRRLIAMAATVVALTLIDILMVGAIERASAQTRSASATGPARPCATESERRLPTTVRILPGPGQPASTPALRILGDALHRVVAKAMGV